MDYLNWKSMIEIKKRQEINRSTHNQQYKRIKDEQQGRTGRIFVETIIDEGNVLIFHYEKTTQKCFIGWFLNHFQEGNTAPFHKLFPIISALKNTDTKDYAVVASTIDIFEVHEITSQGVKKASAR